MGRLSLELFKYHMLLMGTEIQLLNLEQTVTVDNTYYGVVYEYY